MKEESPILPHQNKSLKDVKDEFWQEIPGFEGFLLLSNFGRLKSLARYVERRNGSKGYWTKDKILSPTVRKTKNNYTGDCTFHLFCNVGYNCKKVHLNIRRLVYKMFVDESLDGKDKRYWVVSMKDGNGLNCQPSNLELIHVKKEWIEVYEKKEMLYHFTKRVKKIERNEIRKWPVQIGLKSSSTQ